MLRRHLLGAVALLLLAISAWYWWHGVNSGGEKMVLASCLRIGLVLSVIWLAWPDLARLPPFLTMVGGGAVAIMLVRPKLAIYLLPLIVVLYLLRPRRGSSARPLRTREQNTKSSGAHAQAKAGHPEDQQGI